MSSSASDTPLPEQQQFIDHALTGHALLVAGPGTGKTWTLARCAAELADEDGLEPDQIGVVTLTRSMAMSLGDRIPHGTASTLHAFALRALNHFGEAADRRIADSWEEDILIRQDLKLGVAAAFDERATLGQVGDFLDRLASAFREDQSEPPEMSLLERRLLTVLTTQRELFRYRLLDELVATLLRLLETGAEGPPFPKVMLVDEYQDLTAGELRLLKVMADTVGTRVVACGDDRQSIFGFRDADLLALHRFSAVYGLGSVDVLNKSRRCAAQICEFAEHVAEALPPVPGLERPGLVAWDPTADPGVVELIQAKSPIGEARWVVTECKKLIEQEGVRPHEIMIVVCGYRDAVMRNLNDAVAERDDLPFAFYDPTAREPIAEARSVRLLNAAVRLLMDPHDHLAWRTIIWATPGIGESRLTELLTAGKGTYLQNIRALADRDAAVGRALNAGEQVIERFSEMEAVDGQEIADYLAGLLGLATDPEELLPLLEKIESPAGAASWTEAVFELSQKILVPPEERPEEIPVRTIFSAKGLEARVVFAVNAIPQAFVVGGDPADGVRRLYVAVSRAKERLYVSAPGNLRYTTVGHSSGANWGGLAEPIVDAGSRMGLAVDRP